MTSTLITALADENAPAVWAVGRPEQSKQPN